MRLSEGDLAAWLHRNPSLRVRENTKKPQRPIPKPKGDFDSKAEETFYQEYIQPQMLTGEIVEVEMHRVFEILPALTVAGIKFRAKRYTPDFVLTFADGKVLVVEVKGKMIKKLQRDYQLRIHLFALRYLLPSGWEFREVAAEDVTGGKEVPVR